MFHIKNPAKRIDFKFEQHIKNLVCSLLSHKNKPSQESIATIPTLLSKKNYRVLFDEDYYVTELFATSLKLLLFTTNTPMGLATFSIDKDFRIGFFPHLLFPFKDVTQQAINNSEKFQTHTLIDGEIIKTKGTDCFLASDVLIYNGTVLIDKNYDYRLGILQSNIIESFNKHKEKDSKFKETQPFDLQLKKVERSYGLFKIIDRINKNKLKYKGMVFTPVKRPYKLGECDTKLQFTVKESNTANLKIMVSLNTDRKPIYKLFVKDQNKEKFYEYFQPTSEEYAKWRTNPPNNRVAQFIYDPNFQVTVKDEDYTINTYKGGWKFVKFFNQKTYKGSLNNEHIANKVKKCALDGQFDLEELESFEGEIRKKWKDREPSSLSIKLFSKEIESKNKNNMSKLEEINQCDIKPEAVIELKTHDLNKTENKKIGSKSDSPIEKMVQVPLKTNIEIPAIKNNKNLEDKIENEKKIIKLEKKLETKISKETNNFKPTIQKKLDNDHDTSKMNTKILTNSTKDIFKLSDSNNLFNKNRRNNSLDLNNKNIKFDNSLFRKNSEPVFKLQIKSTSNTETKKSVSNLHKNSKASLNYILN